MTEIRRGRGQHQSRPRGRGSHRRSRLHRSRPRHRRRRTQLADLAEVRAHSVPLGRAARLGPNSHRCGSRKDNRPIPSVPWPGRAHRSQIFWCFLRVSGTRRQQGRRTGERPGLQGRLAWCARRSGCVRRSRDGAPSVKRGRRVEKRERREHLSPQRRDKRARLSHEREERAHFSPREREERARSLPAPVGGARETAGSPSCRRSGPAAPTECRMESRSPGCAPRNRTINRETAVLRHPAAPDLEHRPYPVWNMAAENMQGPFRTRQIAPRGRGSRSRNEGTRRTIRHRPSRHPISRRHGCARHSAGTDRPGTTAPCSAKT